MSTLTGNYRELVPLGWSDGLDVAAVLAGQGMNPSDRAARWPALQAAAVRALREGASLLAPAIATRIVSVEHAGLSEVVLAGGAAIRDEAPVRALSGSLQVLVGACTIGEDTDRRAAEAMRDDPTLAMAFDGLGTAALNLLSSAICRNLRSDAALSRQRTTSPLSPGEGDWDLAEGQRLVFALCEPGRIGIALTAQAQMRPHKSLSFLIGIGPTVKEHPSTCGGCRSGSGCQWKRLRA